MKRGLLLAVLLLTLCVGCSRSTAEYSEVPLSVSEDDTIPADDIYAVASPVEEPTPVKTPAPPPPEISLPFDTVATFLAHTQDMFDRDGGALWGFPFHVPIMVVDPVTRDAIANRADPAGYLAPFGDVFYGTLPEEVHVWAVGVVTASSFGGEEWVIMSWPTVQSRSAAHRLGLAAHYAMHWHQRCADFFGGFVGFDNSHMNELEARMSIRLEMNALTTAFRATGDARRAYVADALAIRAERRRVFGHAEDENLFLNLEGLAQFTEMALPATSATALRARVLQEMESMAYQIRDVGLERMFGYFVGAMYAFLLNETDAPWARNVHNRADLGYMLKEAMDINELPPIETVDVTRFGYAAISREERQWADNRIQMLARLTGIFVNQPTLIIYESDLTAGISAGFSGHMVSFAEFGSIIIGGSDLTGSFGTLNLRSGYCRIDAADATRFFMVPAQNLEMDGNRITSQSLYGNRRHSSWTMYLNEGYSIIEYGNGFRVVHTG
ncbi:MAG: hypothetical protein FWB88_05475 [Defluviitaleaceae bacterium]|nr:hypothetical protein [Defluviitaleaceae bacterium]MCL2239618.1 hypothetical protein [Defluviitaleaceae bacterium]